MKKITKVLAFLMTFLFIFSPMKLYAKEPVDFAPCNMQQNNISPYGAWTKDEVCFLTGGAFVTVRLLIADSSPTSSKIIGLDIVKTHTDIGISDINIISKGIYGNGSYAKVEVSYKNYGITQTKIFTLVAP